jgi:hypothetical protein
LDGVQVDAAAIPLVNDGRTHDVQIVLGDPGAEHPILGLNSRGVGLSTVFAESTR